MADRFTYGTGMSAQPINIAAAGQQIMQTAVEQKLADIEQQRAMATESQKSVLEAMSMKTIQGLDRKTQERYQQQFEEHRKKIVDKMAKGGGVLSVPEQMQIRNEREDLINQTIADSNALKRRDEARKFGLDPNTPYGYNMEGALKELREWDKAFEKGEYLGDPTTIWMKHQVEAPVSGYIARRYEPAINQLDVEALGDFKGNVFTETEFTGLNVKAQESIDKARRLRDVMMQDPNIVRRYTAEDGTVFEDKKAEIQKQIEDSISKKISETKPYRASTSVGATRELRELSPKKVELASGEYTDYVDYPASQSEKRFTINRATNEETGREDTFGTAQSMRVIGFAPKENKVFFVSEGGQLKRGGKPVLGIEGYVSDEDKIETKKESGITLDEVTEDNQRIFTQLAKQSKFGDSDKATRITNVDVVDNGDGTYTVKGKVEKWVDKGLLGTGIAKAMVKKDDLDTKKHKLEDSEEVSITLNTLTDPKETTRYSAPLSEYEEVVSELYQYGIDGQKVSDYYKGVRGKKGTTGKDSLGIL